MKFPDRQTCKLISSEFPESEFVYLTGDISRPARREDVGMLQQALGVDESDHLYQIDCAAPTTDEMGLWFKGWVDAAPSFFDHALREEHLIKAVFRSLGYPQELAEWVRVIIDGETEEEKSRMWRKSRAFAP